MLAQCVLNTFQTWTIPFINSKEDKHVFMSLTSVKHSSGEGEQECWVGEGGCHIQGPELDPKYDFK